MDDNFGIYIHIPFCKKKCPYCDFYSVVRLKYADDFVKALVHEFRIKKILKNCKKPKTIYLGGGTPSVLNSKHLSKIIEALHKYYDLSHLEEFSIEANPEDVTDNNVKLWLDAGINRVSLGIQSFVEEELTFLGRRNSVQDNIRAIEILKSYNVQNISVDLIYGIPGFGDYGIDVFVKQVLKYDLPHLSAYHLGIEDNTVFGVMKRRGVFKEISQTESEKQYLFLIRQLKSIGFEHYEISNFAKQGKYAIHNTGYWKGMLYVGFGPSAHSFDGKKRCENISNLYKYINYVLQSKNEFCFCEDINTALAYNDYILVSFRTMWGVDLDKIKSFGSLFYDNFIKIMASKYEHSDLIEKTSTGYRLTEKGMFVSDGIIADFFFI